VLRSFWKICPVTSRKLRLPQCIMGDDLHINKQTNICIANHRRLLRQNNALASRSKSRRTAEESRTKSESTAIVY
jgi:hypothetical protein